MVVSLLANIGIILLNLYVIWKLGGVYFNSDNFTTKQVIQFIILESVAGISLIYYAVTIADTRFDFRIILFALSMKYLGSKVTIPTIFILSLARFYFDGFWPATFNFVVAIIFMLSIIPVFKLAKKHFNGVGQLLTIVYYNLLLTLPLIIDAIGDLSQIFWLMIIIIIFSTAFIWIVYGVMGDVRTLSNLSVIDGLTNLYNSRKLHQDLELLSNNKHRYSLVILDIDDFKCYNDLHGHLIGDRVIQKISNLLTNVDNGRHIFYRYGGEEFVAIVQDDTENKAYSLANEIRDEINLLTIPDESGGILKVSVSIGIAYQFSDEALMSTFDRADKALYIAKVNGKDQIKIG